MTFYEVQWTEHIKRSARIEEPPPNEDERVLAAAQELINVAGVPMPRLIAWAHAQTAVKPVLRDDDMQEVTYDITLIGKVELVQHPAKGKGKYDMTEERVVPL
jgi:hypothetical protein